MRGRRLAPLALCAALSCAPAPVVVPPPPVAPQAPKEPAVMEWKGQFSPENSPWVRVIKSAESWARLWKGLGGEAPPADFSRHFAVAVFAGQKPTGGYAVKLLEPEVDEAAGTWTLRYRVSGPGGMMVIQALTQPYAVRLYARTALEVKVEPAAE